MGSMMSSLSVFSGAGTILGPLISMAGPGIMVTVMSMIASVVMNTVITPLLSQFNTTVLSNDLDTLMTPLGGTSTGALAILDNIASLMSVSSQPGAVSQDSGSGYIAQSTGSSVGTSSTSNPLSPVGNTCNITAIGTCLASEFNDTLLLSQTALDNSNGVFSVFTIITGELLTAMETLTGSSSTPATSTVAPATAITTSSAATSTVATPATTPTDYAHILGDLALIKDIVGLGKTFFTDEGALFLLQSFRTYVDWVQLLESIQYQHDYPSSVIPILWVVKSTVSGLTNLLGLINDLNNVVPQSFATENVLSKAYSIPFSAITQVLKASIQLDGAIIFYLLFTNGQSTILKSNLQTATDFMYAYVGQRIIKVLLFMLKSTGIKSKLITNFERFIYVASAGLNIAQMIYG